MTPTTSTPTNSSGHAQAKLLGCTCRTCGRPFAVNSWDVHWQSANLLTNRQTGVVTCSYKGCGSPVTVIRELTRAQAKSSQVSAYTANNIGATDKARPFRHDPGPVERREILDCLLEATPGDDLASILSRTESRLSL